jgi:hypothetical protein
MITMEDVNARMVPFPDDYKLGWLGTVTSPDSPFKTKIKYDPFAWGQGNINLPEGKDICLVVTPDPRAFELFYEQDRDYLAPLSQLPPAVIQYLDIDKGHGVEELKYLSGLTGLKSLSLNALKISSESPELSYLQNLQSLETLDMGGTNLQDVHLDFLGKLKGLKRLFLNETLVGDPGLTHLKALGHLEELDLSSSKVTDAGIPNLHPLERLKTLTIFALFYE